jgi:RecA-family ATPase
VSTAPEEIKWTVEGIIQREGSGLIIGDSGASKSLLAFDLAIHLVAGVAWFHHKIPERLRVGLVAREDAPGLSQSRLMRLIEGSSEAVKMFLEGLDLESWLYINTRSQRETWSLQKDSDVQEIIEATKERGIHFLFFDVFRTLWEGNENDNQETAKVLAAAKQIEREANCQVCIIHHLSKSDRGTIFDRARGGGINGWKEWGIGITVENPDAQPRDKIRKMYFHTKASVDADPIHYRIDGYDRKVELVEVDPPTQEYSFKKGKKDKKEPEPQSPIPF